MATATLEKLVSVPRYSTLRVSESADASVHWCHMHADLATAPGRACFKPMLVADILQYQRLLSDRLQRERNLGDTTLQHVVLASDCDAFNLGGDLEYFCDAIRRQDRAALLNYARQCVLGVHAFHAGLDAGAHSIALVQGDALGGGFEAVLSFNVIVAEKGSRFGLPEIAFGLFPGMGAHSLLARKVGLAKAEEMMLSNRVYSAEEMHALGLVHVLAEPGKGEEAVRAYIAKNGRRQAGHRGIYRASSLVDAISLDELNEVVEVWADAALNLSESELKLMRRLVDAQSRLAGA